LDGLGRVVLVQDSRTNAYVKYEHDARSCSPNRHQVKVSDPYLRALTGFVVQDSGPDRSPLRR